MNFLTASSAAIPRLVALVRELEALGERGAGSGKSGIPARTTMGIEGAIRSAVSDAELAGQDLALRTWLYGPGDADRAQTGRLGSRNA
ncbi:MAG: hypothetical protein ABSH33_15360 [Steroidobacteraceae bacterium]|jgi:hypothetical protein